MNEVENRANGALEPGLYLVATPIGNLEDITLRALRVLRSCRLVAAEDTRRIRKLLNHFDIKVKTISYREQNRSVSEPQILDLLRQGEAVALVSDAGMPCISDPGAVLIKACDANGLPVFVVPGPSAVTAAIARTGLPADKFIFLGFPPHKKNQRINLFEEYAAQKLPLVFFESPHRIIATLADTRSALGNRRAWLMREMTKLHEEVMAGRIDEILAALNDRESIKGEITLVVAGAEAEAERLLSDGELRKRYAVLLSEGIEPGEALKKLVRLSGRKKRDLYTLLRTNDQR